MSYRIIFILFILTTLFSCKETAIPRPRGYFRIDLPSASKYYNLSDSLPYTFKVNENTRFTMLKNNENPYWANLVYDDLGAIIHISYIPVKDNLYELLEDSRAFVFKHSSKADAINQEVFAFPEKNVYGIIYDLDGAAASPMQFISTDSISHFVRGVLYFKARANQDSLQPLIDYVEKDIRLMVETFNWQ